MFSKSPTGLFFFSCEMTILSFLLLKCSRSGKIQRTPPSQTLKTCWSSTWPRWMLYLQGWFSKVLPTAKSRENKCSISFWEVLVFGVHTALCDLNSPLRQAWLFLSHRKTSAASWYFYKIVLIYIDLYKKKYSWWPGESWDWFGRKRRKYRQHCPTSQVHPWQDLLWNRLQIMICSFKSEHVVQIAIILINSQACWDNSLMQSIWTSIEMFRKRNISKSSTS